MSGLVVIGVTFLVVAFAFWAKRQARLQRFWPQVPGVVVTSRVDLMQVFVPVVEFRFSYEGRPYLGKQVWTLEVMAGWPGPARRLVEAYPVGKPVTVWVDTRDPSNSVLVPGGDRKFMPFVFAMAGIAVYVGVRLWVE